MIRRLIKAGAASALHRAGISTCIGWGTGRAAAPLVVGYHRVVEDFGSNAREYMPAMLVSTAMLERQLDWIGRRFEFAEPDDMATWLDGGKPKGRPVAVITFDDGYRDVYEQAFPLLRRKGIPAIVFVVTDLVGTADLQVHDELYLLLSHALTGLRAGSRLRQQLSSEAGLAWPEGTWKDLVQAGALVFMRKLLTTLPQARLRAVIDVLKKYVEIDAAARSCLISMDWEMLAELQRAGMKIGSHTRSHALLTNEDQAKTADELEGARSALSHRLGIQAMHFAYPDGRFSKTVAKAVADAGYSFGYTTCRHRDAAYPDQTISRKLLWENASLDALGRFSPSVMSCQVNGVFDFVARCRMDHAA